MTLLEVMVALVIFSTAALALMNSVSLNVRFTHGLADTLQASWVAEINWRRRSSTDVIFLTLKRRGQRSWAGAAGPGESSA